MSTGGLSLKVVFFRAANIGTEEAHKRYLLRAGRGVKVVGQKIGSVSREAACCARRFWCSARRAGQFGRKRAGRFPTGG